jgi:outer membrane lipoprotein-sorting protein
MLRRLPTAHLVVFLAATCAALAGCAAIAFAALGGSGDKPPAKPLATAVHDALAAPAVKGVTARITFTNRLIDSSSLLNGASPLLSGATGRLWAAADGRFRLELQSDNGDAQITGDGDVISVYDATTNDLYRITLPRDRGTRGAPTTHGVPSLGAIQSFLTRIAGKADLSGAKPSDVAGRPAYTVRISPKHDGGLIGAGELAFDAANGTPLRAAIYASGDPKPVLALEATDISFGPVSGADLAARPPADANVTDLDLRGQGAHGAPGPRRGLAGPQGVTGPAAVAAALPFKLSAPATLVGLPRGEVRLVQMGGEQGALVTYGAGLGGIAVLQQPAEPGGAQQQPGSGRRGGGLGGLALPKVSIDGTDGQELATALGTVVRFQRDGVQYTIVGSVPPSAAEAAARAL